MKDSANSASLRENNPRMKQRASQPQIHSPCPRASARSVLTDRRPTERHAPRAARVLRAPGHLVPNHLQDHVSQESVTETWPNRAKHILFLASSVSPEGRFCVFCGKTSKWTHVGETARKPASKPLSVPPCLRALRVNRPEVSRPPRAEGGAGTSRVGPTSCVFLHFSPCTLVPPPYA